MVSEKQAVVFKNFLNELSWFGHNFFQVYL